MPDSACRRFIIGFPRCHHHPCLGSLVFSGSVTGCRCRVSPSSGILPEPGIMTVFLYLPERNPAGYRLERFLFCLWILCYHFLCCQPGDGITFIKIYDDYHGPAGRPGSTKFVASQTRYFLFGTTPGCPRIGVSSRVI
jgi:hypothetical protein